MTEAEWLACTDPVRMLDYAAGRLSVRKLWLFAARCHRRPGLLTPRPNVLRVAELADAFADGKVGEEELRSEAAPWIRGQTYFWGDAGDHQYWVDRVLRPEQAADLAARYAVELALRLCLDSEREQWVLAAFLRDIAGDPCRPVTLGRHWLTPDVLDLARGMYENRRHGDTDILADALEDAGCADEAVLGHCREPVHLRGCWVVDLILGKE